MLILARQVGESINIGNDVVICVESISGTRIKLGLKAPAEISIIRSELSRCDRDELCSPCEPSAVSND